MDTNCDPREARDDTTFVHRPVGVCVSCHYSVVCGSADVSSKRGKDSRRPGVRVCVGLRWFVRGSGHHQDIFYAGLLHIQNTGG